MKICFLAAFLLQISSLNAQILIHAHNDYEKPEPLFNALRQKAFVVEADVYLVDGNLLVAHDRKDLDSNRTLSRLYLDPLDSMFRANHGYVSSDKSYKPALAVDIKASGSAALLVIQKLINAHPNIFDSKRSKGAIYVLVSGDRGPIAEWKKFPPAVRFDGRPTETYDTETLKKVVTISESYGKYYNNGTLKRDSLLIMIKAAHAQKKLVRIWGAPDFPATWKAFLEMGIDIINTDKPEEARKTFAGTKPVKQAK
jgi:glycerophosphoryl diester phosphodiesterase family protein